MNLPGLPTLRALLGAPKSSSSRLLPASVTSYNLFFLDVTTIKPSAFLGTSAGFISLKLRAVVSLIISFLATFSVSYLFLGYTL